MAKTVTAETRAAMQRGGQWLRRRRERAGFTTGTAFADALGIKQVRLSSYERGQYQVEPDIARAIARLLDLSEWEVWRGLELPLPRELDPSAMSDAEVIAAVEARWPGKIAEILASGNADPPSTPQTTTDYANTQGRTGDIERSG